MGIVEVKTMQQFVKLQEAPGIVVAHFQADWAPQCKQINDVLEELLSQPQNKNVVFTSIIAEDVAELCQKYSVSAVPTVIITCTSERGSQPALAGRVDGAKPADLTTLVQTLVAKASLTGVGTTAARVTEPVDINTRLKKLISSAPCMLFMKGNPQQPKCGFSRTTIELLTKYDVHYSTFDILADDDVRQGLKIYSNWPTYPQLYLNGDLVGGLDILKEMDSSGELEPMLPKKVNLEERLKKLTSQAPLMVFIKGTRDTPRCGFSRTIVQILNDISVPYETFDILQDEEVRQGLKSFSNWPTYPQVYVKGELIGGLDIVKEMSSDGSLMEALKEALKGQ
uniref:Glutaredoxin-3-like n=1 Tax=Hirondellea gigas TaxID=1518452 RepID=A0A2P2I4J9_9CRUS